MPNRPSILPLSAPPTTPTPGNTPESRLEPLERLDLAAAGAAKPNSIRGTWQQKLQTREPGRDPLIRTPEDEADHRHLVLSALEPVGAPGTRYHVTMWPAEEPPPKPPQEHTWLRLDWSTWRLAADPPEGCAWGDEAIATGPYRRRFLDPELTEDQVQHLLTFRGNVENMAEADNPERRRLRTPHATSSIAGKIGLPTWHVGSEWEYNWTLPSGQINRNLPNDQIKSQYRRPDGRTDWLRWVRDQFEAEMGYAQIMAFWQYLDERARDRAPGVSEAALESGIPKLRPTNVPKYIAAVSLALQAKRITQEEANALLYAAQLLIGALKAIGPVTPGKPRGRHVTAQTTKALPILTAEVTG